jgi:hypothetical protein
MTGVSGDVALPYHRVVHADSPNAPADEPDRPDPAYLDRFAWHPEPEAIAPRHEQLSRATLEELGRATWDVALDDLYGHAVTRSLGAPPGYDEVRHAVHGERGGPGPAPGDPTPARAMLDDCSRPSRRSSSTPGTRGRSATSRRRRS